MLLGAKEQGILKAAMGENTMMMTGACETETNRLAVSGPGESPPVVERLDLWHRA